MAWQEEQSRHGGEEDATHTHTRTEPKEQHSAARLPRSGNIRPRARVRRIVRVCATCVMTMTLSVHIVGGVHRGRVGVWAPLPLPLPL